MHPAFSVLIFTVISGAGYGLIFFTIVGHLLGFEILQSKEILLYSSGLACVFISAGLLASTLHLTNPKNAWRAFSRFKTSWLSREAVFALLFYPFILTYMGGIWLEIPSTHSLIIISGTISSLLAILTLFCTSMIYASLKTISQWNNALTPLSYISLGLMSGVMLLLTLQSLLNSTQSDHLLTLTYFLLLLGLSVKLLYFFWIGKPSGSTIKTATGFTQMNVRLLDQGHSSNGFLNNEFGYTVAANKLYRLRVVTILVAFVCPAFLIAMNQNTMLVLAVGFCFSGLLIERWLFFAEARHVVRLYQAQQKG